jgi:hypothetical protein
MKDLIKKILSEQALENISTGCDYFDKKSYDYRWCKSIAEKSLSRNMKIANQAIETYKSDFLAHYNEGLRAQIYDPSHHFFTDRGNLVKETLKKFEATCPKLYNYIVSRMQKFMKSYVILNSKNEYDLLNKLNSNWSAMSLLLTSELPEQYKDLKKYTFKQAQEYYFRQKDNNGITPFEKTMGKWENEQNLDIREKIYNTIRAKTSEGQKIEDEFFEYIKKYVPVEQFAGEYSFLDMIGIDMIIQTPDGNWIPVQVKKYGGACNESEDDPTKLGYRDFMCENWCVSYEKMTWRIKTFKGRNLQKNKSQCKNLPLNMTSFLNVHTHETDVDNEFCVKEPDKLEDINF